MSLKIPDYTAKTWVNDASPPLDADNLQEMDDVLAFIGGKTLGSLVYIRAYPVATDGKIVTATINGNSYNATFSNNLAIINILEYGACTISIDGYQDRELYIDNAKTYDVTVGYAVYGVRWDGTASTAWSRTDNATFFTDPIPAVNNGNGSSPFDSIMPWSGMVRSTDAQCGEVVAIPKFYYKWSKEGDSLALQISPISIDGFSVSPAHQDRGDGQGERDVVYIGRYHSVSGYKSTTNLPQISSITRSIARAGIHNLGAYVWQMDYATHQTIQMLYLVEFADWNSQTKIGYGCSASGAKVNNGQTDAMSYHTGTTAVSRTTYGYTQYRNIEGLWDNVYDWMDGCYNNSGGLNIILNPSQFSDTTNGVNVGAMPSNGFPTKMKIGTNDWTLMAEAIGGSNTTYIPDSWTFDASLPCLYVGGNYSQSFNLGLFRVGTGAVSYDSTSVGCRLQKLP